MCLCVCTQPAACMCTAWPTSIYIQHVECVCVCARTQPAACMAYMYIRSMLCAMLCLAASVYYHPAAVENACHDV